MLIYANKIFNTPIETIEIFAPKEVKSALDKIELLQSKVYARSFTFPDFNKHFFYVPKQSIFQ